MGAVVAVGVAVGGEFHVEHVVLAGERLAAAFRERFAGVGGARWGADVEDERVGAGVGGGHHVADGLFGQDLCFVEHDDVYGVVASGEALGSCAEQYLAAVGEGDFLHAVAAAHAVGAAGVVEVSDERGVAYQGAHVVERVAVGTVVVRGPDDGQVRDERAQDDHEAGDGEGLAGLAADAQHHAADGGGERAVGPSAEDERQQSLLPAVVADAACFGALVDLGEHAGDDAGGHDDVTCDLR